MSELINPFEFLTRLPDATITAPFEKHPGIFISAAFIEGEGRNVIIECLHGENVPQRTYTLNIGGRGSLVVGEQEFRDLLSSGIAMFEVAGMGFTKDEPTPVSSACPASLPESPTGE